MSLTFDRARDLLTYNPDKGLLRWAVDKGTSKAGELAGYWQSQRDGQRRLVIRIDGKNYLGHRVAWLLTYGAFPGGLIDHRDCNMSNNRLANLREATDSQNKVNRPASVRSSSGLKGVRRSRGRKINCKWDAVLSVEGRQKLIGTFLTREEAQAAYQSAARAMHGEFAHTS